MMPRPQQSEPSAFKYRPDIDGLRAVAVVPVVLYHFLVPPFGGGFVGVDVFFVISGFLITSLIDVEIQAKRFSIVNFYERRARRILPALIVMIAAVIVGSLFLLFPSDLKKLAQSVIAATLFASNFEFWREAGYFDTTSAVKPLLHTWSLAVEEQFYLLFPPTLMLLERFFSRRTGLAIIAAVLVASFALSLWGVTHAPTATFYLPFARMWELALGALLAFGAVPLLRNRALCTVLAAIGLALIAWSVFAFTADTPFPGTAALFPCVGTALVLYAGMAAATPVSALLGSRPFVAVGLISYSFYLWHWPVYVLARYERFEQFTPLQTALLIALAALLAVLSWRYVEQPIRRRTVLKDRRSLFAAAAVSLAALAAVSLAILALHELPQRFPPEIQNILKGSHDFEARRTTCFDRELARVARGDLCTIGAVHPGAPDFILWGDSHADALLPAVEAAARRHAQYGLFAGRSACPPFPGVDVIAARPSSCRQFASDVLKIIADRHIGTVVLAARWAIYTNGTRYGAEGGNDLRITDAGSSGTSLTENAAVFARAFPGTVRALLGRGLRVIVIGPVPEIGARVPETLAKIRMLKSDKRIEPSMAAFLARQKLALATIAKFAPMPGVRVVYPQQVLCGPAQCEVQLGGLPLYTDNNHLSTLGASLVAPLLDKAFADKGH